MKTALGTLFVVLSLGAGSGCSKVSQASTDGEKAPGPSAASPARPSLDNANYRAEIRRRVRARATAPAPPKCSSRPKASTTSTTSILIGSSSRILPAGHQVPQARRRQGRWNDGRAQSGAEGALRFRNFGCEESRRHAVAERLLGGQLPDGQAAPRSDGEGRLVGGRSGGTGARAARQNRRVGREPLPGGPARAVVPGVPRALRDDPVRYARDAARYMRDMFDYYGTTPSSGRGGRSRGASSSICRGKVRRDAGATRSSARKQVQGEIYRVLSNFAQEGRPNKLILLHGPNGSRKSTVAACMMRALEHYSSTDEGALYRFHWVFPEPEDDSRRASASAGREDVGVRPGELRAPRRGSDRRAALHRDPRPSALPPARRRSGGSCSSELYREAGDGRARRRDWLLRGRLSHKSQQVFEALLSSYKGSLTEVLRHVQVERYFISQRYRMGAVTIGPQMSRRRGRAADHGRSLARGAARRRSRRSRSSRRTASSSKRPAGCSSSAIS